MRIRRIEITSVVIKMNLVLWAIALLWGEDQVNCCHVDDYCKCIRIRDMKRANRRICLDEECSDEKGLSRTLIPYSLVCYKKGCFFFYFWVISYENGNNMK